jgi:hypothetical protein
VAAHRWIRAKSGDADGLQTYSSGEILADTFSTCLEATNPSSVASTSLAVGGQNFNIEAWPEDPSWASTVSGDVQIDVPKLEDLTGLKMPGGTVVIREAGDLELGTYAGLYDSTTKTVALTEDSTDAAVAHELSYTLFDPLFAAQWMDEGFAHYSERVVGAGSYTPCTDPGPYPGSGSPDLATWKQLGVNPTAADQSVFAWQYAASCYLMTELADAIGPANFKAILGAASWGEIPYLGATPPELASSNRQPISAEALLDLIDEWGMVPAGITDLDEAQKLFASYGAITTDELGARSQARSNYHQLIATAGTWKIPLAVRGPMANWDFTAAQTAMDTVTQILTLRGQATTNLAGLSLDGTALQTQFEAAQTQSDLAAVLTLAKNEADAAAKVAQANQLYGGGHSILQTIGLLGTDLSAPLAQAKTALSSAKPADASGSAQKVIDAVNGSSDQGLMRSAALIGLLFALLLLVLFLRARRRHAVAVLVPPDGPLDNAVAQLPPGAEATLWVSDLPGPTTPEPVSQTSPGLISDDELAAKRSELP